MFACVLLFIVGESSNHSGNEETEESAEKQDIISMEDSPKERGSTSRSGTDTANTPQTVVGANDKSLNDAMLNDTSVSDTSISSMSELSGNTSFHEEVYCAVFYLYQSAIGDDVTVGFCCRPRRSSKRFCCHERCIVTLPEIINSLTFNFAQNKLKFTNKS